MSLPSHQTAVKTDGDGTASVHTDAPIPKLANGFILVKTSHVALNPTDWKHISRSKEKDQANFTAGCDFSGTIIEVGKGVTKPLKKGDRVAGFTHGIQSRNPDSGAFAEYIIAKGDVVAKIGPNVTDAEAATIGVGFMTCGQGLYQSLELPQPEAPATDKPYLLIYGGSTATALFGIQLARLSGLNTVVTCSPRNFDLVKKLGADVAFDYRDADACVKSIRDYTNNSLMYAFDCISEGESPEICAKALSDSSVVKYSALLPSGPEAFPREDVKLNTFTLGYTGNGEEFEFFGNTVSAKPEDFEFQKKWMAQAEQLINERKVIMTPTLREGGLNGIVAGLDDLKNGRVSGQKLVYKIG